MRRATTPSRFLPIVFVLLSASAVLASQSDVAELDSDRDGIPDRQEIEQTGTDPFKKDTDGDGVMDGHEDRNHDGLITSGESDPLVHGLFPGAYPHIPEPMVFDLVRGLGARKGELEANTLVVGSLRPRRDGVDWAPEIEWAFADGHAAELELPMRNGTIAAYKLALQGTIPERRPRFIHGWQVIAEYVRSEGLMEGTALYLAGYRVNRVISLLGMGGARTGWWPGLRSHTGLVLNVNTFLDLRETLTLGLETNLQRDRHAASWALIPQMHWQLARHLRTQLGGGVAREQGRMSPLLAFRIVVE